MGLFSRKKKAKMEIPPPPPPEGGEMAPMEPATPAAPMPSAPRQMKRATLPPKESMHIPSELPEIKPLGKMEKPAPMPEFPAMPGDEAEKMPEPEAAEMPSAPKMAPAPEMPAEPEEEKPKFVSVSNFQTILSETNEIKASIKKAEDSIARLNTLKTEEEKAFSSWRSQLEDVEKKLSYIDQVIFKGA